ncbi:hypothetical protein [Streptococcus suis]|uniref:hypothetical protein n=1 Tax=Streptococcus suis TaxID=1307 RepID=UPI000CF3A6DC
MKIIVIDNIIRGMKKQGITKGMGKLGSDPLTVDLDGFYIGLGSNSFELSRIPGTKGGHRYFFLCPECRRRCRKLYKRYLFYACGNCQQVHKQTLNRSKTDCQYYWERALREARKVQPGWTPERGGYMFDSFPSRPKRMKRDKYYKHYQRFLNYVRKGDSYWLKGLSR